MKKLLIIIIGLLVVMAGYLYASPYLALNGIKNAAQTKDADKLSGYIDFPSVKQSIKDQVKVHFAKEMIASENNDGFEALGAMLATAMIDPLVDGLITPDGIALMLQGEDLNSKESSSTQEQSTKNNNVDYKTSYTSFNSFQVEIDNPEKEDAAKIIMHRDGLSWKVTRIDLPLNDF